MVYALLGKARRQRLFFQQRVHVLALDFCTDSHQLAQYDRIDD
ncbi:MAG: hypothetical protein RLZZ66_2154 [Pseudomonadota bacterium]|jgi:hypothetical protein